MPNSTTETRKAPMRHTAQPCPYDVALSFAGENRDLARTLAEGLRAAGFHVFFDEFERVRLWGANLQEELGSVYLEEARYCIVLVSEHYLQKEWTNHERQAALARSIKARSNTVLAIKLDESELPGLLPTIGYVDAKNFTALQIVELAVQKLRTLTPDRPADVLPAVENRTTASAEIEPADKDAPLDEVEATNALMAVLNQRYGTSIGVEWDQRPTPERRYRLNIVLALIVALQPDEVFGCPYQGDYGQKLFVHTFKRGRFRDKAKNFNSNLPLAKLKVGNRTLYLYLNPLILTTTRTGSSLVAILDQDLSNDGREIDWENDNCLLFADAYRDDPNSGERESLKAFKAIPVPHHLFCHQTLYSKESRLAESNGFQVLPHIDTLGRALAAWRTIIADNPQLRPRQESAGLVQRPQSVHPDIEIKTGFKRWNKFNQQHHDYELQVGFLNNGLIDIDRWRAEVYLPRMVVLPQLQPKTTTPEASGLSKTHCTFLFGSEFRKQAGIEHRLLRGHNLRLHPIRYFVNQRMYYDQQFVFSLPVRIVLYIDGKQPIIFEKPFGSNFENF